MDWNLKGASWDLTELDEAALPNIETIENNNNNGSSRFGFGVGLMNRSKGEFCVDLKLGHQVGNNSGTQESSGAKWKDHAVAVAAATAAGGVSKTTSSACSGSSKRARAISNGAQTASCLVDGCNSDLSNCRDYHRRHKVCELHSKTPVVTIGGHKQRFCQQCSRFHSLEEFDEGKRSCRKRLDGHNRRRRKPQPVPLTRSASFLSNYQGTQMLPFPSSSHVYPSSGTVNPCWDARFQQVHKQELLILGSSAMATPTSSYNNKEGNDNKQQERAYLQGDKYGRRVAVLSNQNADLEAVSAPASVCQTLVRTGRPFSIEESPPCALSLLSSPVQAHTPMSLVQPLGLTLHDHTLESVDTTVLVNNGTSLYNMGSHGSPQSHPFHWE